MSAVESVVNEAIEHTTAPSSDAAQATTQPESYVSQSALGAPSANTEAPPEKVESEAPKTEAAPERPQAESWHKQLSKELQTDPTLSRYKSLDDLAKALLEQKKTLTKRNKDMSPEDLAFMHKQLGVPDKADAYKFKLPEGMSRDEGMEKLFQQASLEGKLTPEQANTAYNVLAKAEYEANQKYQNDIATQEKNHINTLKQEFGAGYDAEIGRAKSAVLHFGNGPELLKVIDEAGLGSNPTLVKAFAQIGRMIANDQGVDINNSASFNTTPADAARQIDALNNDAEFQAKLWDDRHPGHKAAIEQMMKLRTLKNPGSQLI